MRNVHVPRKAHDTLLTLSDFKIPNKQAGVTPALSGPDRLRCRLEEILSIPSVAEEGSSHCLVFGLRVKPYAHDRWAK
jgi:hypothetical protein